TRYRDRGLLIIGVPSNDFGGQEPGGAAEINKTAHGEYRVSFPLAAKAGVKGPSAHPFYKWAALERLGDGPRWNFHKYLIGKDGRIAAVFSTQIDPTDPRVIAAIEKELNYRHSATICPIAAGPQMRSGAWGDPQGSIFLLP